MRGFDRLFINLVLVLTFTAYSGSVSAAPLSCSTAELSGERSKLQRSLRLDIASSGEVGFLMRGAERRLKELRFRDLNVRGAQCGIEFVQAHVFRCINSTAPSAIQAIPTKEKSVKALWGRAGLSARGAAYIGMFHACRAAAMEAFMSK